jgi:putative membrane protein
MLASRIKFGAAAAALLISGLALASCEKAPGAGGAQNAASSGDDTNGASTVPDLPVLAKPVFNPDLVNMVGGIDLFSIAEDKLALSQSSTPSVKSFATTSLNAHNSSLTGLSAAIDASGETLSVPDSVPMDMQTKVDALQKLSGPAFDKAFLADQIAVQRAEVAALPFFIKHGDNAHLAAFATKVVTSAQSVLASAQSTQSTLK